MGPSLQNEFFGIVVSELGQRRCGVRVGPDLVAETFLDHLGQLVIEKIEADVGRAYPGALVAPGATAGEMKRANEVPRRVPGLVTRACSRFD
jgi:hypothetical protein